MKRISPDQINISLSQDISLGILIVDEDLKITYSGEIVNAMFGYDEKELVGESLYKLIPEKEESPEREDNDLEPQGLCGVRKDGEKFPVEIGLNPIQIEGREAFILAIADISQRRKQQEEILRLNSRLGQLVNERTVELRKIITDLRKEIERRRKAESKAKQALQKERELSELKTKFLSLVSHEFKTPLSVILSSATLAGKYGKVGKTEPLERHLEIIKLKVKNLNGILNDFLSIERLESGESSYKPENFPLSRVINNVIYDANMSSKDGQIINYPENINDLTVHYDEKILELTLTNLINNAIKYSPENTEIDISVIEEKDKLHISVKDRGMGIPEKDQKFIFNPYYRAENAELVQGTGIGLNIVKGHLENLDGQIYFESKEGEGSTFTISIPYSPIEE